MRLTEHPLWLADLEEVSVVSPVLRELAGARVLITGCTGLVCSAVTELLIGWNRAHDEKILICAAGRNENKTAERFFPWSREAWFRFVPYDAVKGHVPLDMPCDYMIHGACNASPHLIRGQPVETMRGCLAGTAGMLDYARRMGRGRTLLISSSEVYGQRAGAGGSLPGEYGDGELLSARSSYPVAKRAAETLCVSYASEYGTDALIVRPGHIYGPTASRADSRVSSAWAYAAAGGRDIVMKSDGSQLRSYCYAPDCASAILTVLLKGKTARAYNISNPDSVIDIRTVADILAECGRVSVRRERPDAAEASAFNPMRDSSLDAAELMALGWRGRFDARRGFSHTVSILRDCRGEGEG